MNNRMIKRFSGGGAEYFQLIKRLSVHYMASILRICKNLMPTHELWYKVKVKSDYFYSLSYRYFDIKDYIEHFGIKYETFKFESGEDAYILNNFYVSTNEITSYIHDENKNVLEQSSPNSMHDTLKNSAFKINIKQDEVVELEEAANFMISFNENYWHFTFTALDKIFALEKRGYKGVYVLPCKPYIKELMTLTGIPDERLFYPEKIKVFKVKKLLIIDSFWTKPYFKNGKQMHEVREKIVSNLKLDNISGYPKNLYVKRIGTRKIRNESELLNYLEQKGFNIMIPEEHSVEEQIKYFYAADVVICPHGANSANALYMRPNTYFVECFGKNMITPCQHHIMKYNKLNYHMIVERRRGENETNIQADYDIDLLLLDSILFNLVSNQEYSNSNL